jgi:hypothetical protein
VRVDLYLQDGRRESHSPVRSTEIIPGNPSVLSLVLREGMEINYTLTNVKRWDVHDRG